MTTAANWRRVPAAAWWLIALGLFGLALIGVTLRYVAPVDPKWFDSVWLEVAKAGVQLFAVGVLGGALSFAWKDLSTTRDIEAERRVSVRAELLDMFALYNDVKSVRRAVRSYGLDPKYIPERSAGPGSAPLTVSQAQGLQEQMVILNSLQLAFESKKRKFSQTNLLRDETLQVVEALRGVEMYLNDILKDVWEVRGRIVIQEGADSGPVSEKLQPFFDTSTFQHNVGARLTLISEIINRQVFGDQASAKTKQQVQAWEAVDNSDPQQGTASVSSDP